MFHVKGVPYQTGEVGAVARGNGAAVVLDLGLICAQCYHLDLHFFDHFFWYREAHYIIQTQTRAVPVVKICNEFKDPLWVEFGCCGQNTKITVSNLN